MLSNRLKLTADVAYVPGVTFTGLDDHLLRQLLLPEASSSGNGVMLEAILGFNITDAWNVGIGGRYWAWNMNTGTETFNFLGAPPPTANQLARFTSERYGMFAQASYKWDDTTPAAKASVLAGAPMNWTGFYVGGHMGGGWSDDHWSDPFGSTPSGLGAINIAGFGDTTHATGPLGGGQVGFDLQNGHAIFGVQLDASAANLSGENTCFSGLGGINCQRVVNGLGSATGRVGYAWDRSLAYVNGGGGWTNATYSLNGNTNTLALGKGSTSVTALGWAAGGGIEYALTNCWSMMVEYNYIGVASSTVPFPTVAVINTQNIAVRERINVVKLGVNYRFNAGPVVKD
jgi:opacity protein-like surface antigen